LPDPRWIGEQLAILTKPTNQWQSQLLKPFRPGATCGFGLRANPETRTLWLAHRSSTRHPATVKVRGKFQELKQIDWWREKTLYRGRWNYFEEVRGFLALWW
jgi:hypothetical protein